MSQIASAMEEGLVTLQPNSPAIGPSKVEGVRDLLKMVFQDLEKWVIISSSQDRITLYGALVVGRVLKLSFAISLRIIIRGAGRCRKVHLESSIRIVDQKTREVHLEEEVEWLWLSPVKYILEMYLQTESELVDQPNGKVAKFFAKSFGHLVSWEAFHQSPYDPYAYWALMALRLKKASVDTRLGQLAGVFARGGDTYSHYLQREEAMSEAKRLEDTIEQIVYPTEVFG